MNETKLTLKNKKEELFNGYFEATEQLQQMKQQQRVLFGVCSVMIILWVL